MHHGSLRLRQHLRGNPPEIQDDVLAIISSALPSFEGKFDPHAYIDWEMKVDTEFDNLDLPEQQMIFFSAASTLTKDALYQWIHLCRHNKVPKTWQDFKFLLRDVYIPAYYVDHLLSKL
jgi:hypothetical protein